MSTLIGALRVTLGLDRGQFERGLTDSEKAMAKSAKRFADVGRSIASVGTKMSIGITAPFAVASKEAMEGALLQRQAMAQVNAALTSMGDGAGRSADQLAKAADAMEMRSLVDADVILTKVTANLLTFGSVSGQVFDRAQQAALDMAQRMGGDVQAAAMLVGKALNAPAKGLAALSRVGIQFTDAQKAQVLAMVEAGNAAGAQGIILGELEKQFGGAAAAAAKTDPYRQMNVAFGQMADVLGEVALNMLPPITTAIKGIADAFLSMSPASQTFAIGAVAAAAALGPLLSAVGAVVQIGVPLVASLTAMGTGGAAAAAGLTPLAPILLPLAAAVAAVVVAWKNWDQIGPILESVASQARTQTATIDSYLRKLTDGANDLDRRMGIPSQNEFMSSLGKWVAETWTTVNQYDLARWAAGVDASIAASFRSAVDSAQRLYQGVQTWLRDRLGGTMQWVVDRAKMVGDAFYTLYDRVVGHSYIPDMVDEIGAHMGRLQQTLVAPAVASTGKAADAFRQLAQTVSPILDRLFPDQARELSFLKDLEAITAYAAKAGWTLAQTTEAVQRLRDEYAKGGGLAPGSTGADVVRQNPGELDQPSVDIPEMIEKMGSALPDFSARAKRSTEEVVRSFADMAQSVGDSIRNLSSGLKSGDFLSSLESVAGVVDIVRRVTSGGGGGLLGQRPVYTSGGYGELSYGGGKASGGRVSPGNWYTVGEHGREAFVPDTAGTIVPNSGLRQAGAGRPVTFDLRGAVMTPDLLQQMESIANQTTGRALTSYATVQARRTKRRLA